MRGDNPKRPSVAGDGSVLEVQEIFATLQGEGPRAGQPAVFVRLGGCNLACDFCDTEFESFRSQAMQEVVAEVLRLAGAARLVVLTGGEPLRQPVGPLCAALMERGFTVQVETNGTLFQPLPEGVEIVCSPKNTGQGYFPPRAEVLERATALKYIVSATHPLYREVPAAGDAVPVYVQPMDEGDAAKNRANLEHVLELARARGYYVSTQLHKLWGIS